MRAWRAHPRKGAPAGDPKRSTSLALVAALILLSGRTATDPVTDQALRRRELGRERCAKRPRTHTMARQVLGAQRQTEVIGRVAVLARLEIGRVRARSSRTRGRSEPPCAPASPGTGRWPSLPVQSACAARSCRAGSLRIVDVPFARLDALQQELGRSSSRALRKRRPGGLTRILGKARSADRRGSPASHWLPR